MKTHWGVLRQIAEGQEHHVEHSVCYSVCEISARLVQWTAECYTSVVRAAGPWCTRQRTGSRRGHYPIDFHLKTYFNCWFTVFSPIWCALLFVFQWSLLWSWTGCMVECVMQGLIQIQSWNIQKVLVELLSPISRATLLPSVLGSFSFSTVILINA